jgi:hypothetical protein
MSQPASANPLLGPPSMVRDPVHSVHSYGIVRDDQVTRIQNETAKEANAIATYTIRQTIGTFRIICCETITDQHAIYSHNAYKETSELTGCLWWRITCCLDWYFATDHQGTQHCHLGWCCVGDR